MKYSIILCLFFSKLYITQVWGWNQLCREAIESTAMSAITYMRLRRLKVLLKGEDLVDYTWWADEVIKRIPESRHLHYQYQPYKKTTSFNFNCSNNFCLLVGIRYFFAMLMNAGYPLEDSDHPKFTIPPFNYPRKINFSPSDCLKYLVVLLSDLHHPLHLDFEPPDSISSISVDLSDFPAWEKLSVEVLKTKRPIYKDFLKFIYMPKYIEANENAWYGSWTHVSTLGLRYSTELDLFNRKTIECFEMWAAETASLNKTLLEPEDFVEENESGVFKLIKFSEKLDSKLGFLMRLQIVMAGARIAIVVNYILSHRDISYDEATGLVAQKPELEFTRKSMGYYAFMGLFSLIIFLFVLFLFFAAKIIISKMSKSRSSLGRQFASTRYQPVNKLPE